MTTIEGKRFVFAGMLAMALVGSSGCSGLNLGEKKGIAARTSVVNETELSPAQRRERFATVYAAGMSHARSREYAEAMAAFEEASRLRPDSTEALFNLAACYESIGDPLRAIGIYNRILRMTPNDADCYHNLGTAYMKLYHLQRSPAWRRMAMDAWERSLRLRPDQPKVKAYLARAAETR